MNLEFYIKGHSHFQSFLLLYPFAWKSTYFNPMCMNFIDFHSQKYIFLPVLKCNPFTRKKPKIWLICREKATNICTIFKCQNILKYGSWEKFLQRICLEFRQIGLSILILIQLETFYNFKVESILKNSLCQEMWVRFWRSIKDRSPAQLNWVKGFQSFSFSVELFEMVWNRWKKWNTYLNSYNLYQYPGHR